MKLENILNRDSKDAQFVRGYLECALWSSNDESDDSGGEPMDVNYDLNDIAPETLEQAIKDCLEFIKKYEYLFCPLPEYDQAGHDFWLTRNGHGSGFWDRAEIYGDSAADTLASKCGWKTEFPAIDLYIGDDGLIYS